VRLGGVSKYSRLGPDEGLAIRRGEKVAGVLTTMSRYFTGKKTKCSIVGTGNCSRVPLGDWRDQRRSSSQATTEYERVHGGKYSPVIFVSTYMLGHLPLGRKGETTKHQTGCGRTRAVKRH